MKLDTRLLSAVYKRRAVSAGNTTITQFESHAEMRLYDTLVARIEYVGNAWIAEPVLEAFQRWPTRLTASRLCLLGIKAHIKDRAAHIDGLPVSTLILRRSGATPTGQVIPE